MNSFTTTRKVTPGSNTYDRFMNTAPGQQGEGEMDYVTPYTIM